MIVPPREVGGCATPGTGAVGQVGQRPGQVPQRQVLRVLDVRYDEAERTRHRDAQVDVVLGDHLSGGVVPRRVERGVVAQGEDHRPRHDRQRRHVQPVEAPVLAQAPDQLHRRRDVDRQEHAGLRRRGHTADHGLGHVPLHAADRCSRLAPVAVRRRLRPAGPGTQPGPRG